ncbi:MAG: hypothetical protein ACOY3E_12635 [Pseudomonadota bacterium]
MHSNGRDVPCKQPGKLLALMLLMPVLTALLALTGQQRIAQFMLLMIGPMVVFGVAASRRRHACLFKQERRDN